MNHFECIIQFFLEIFILQASREDAGTWQKAYEQIPSDTTPDDIYELKIRKGSELKTRRMSIRRIGAAVESKSACYMVTYDDFLVIKIPPAPLPDFDRYLENIEAEKKISEQLAPTITSLAPSLSAILCKVPEISDQLDLNQDAPESDYIRFLKKEPQYQRYLKIGGQFVFFMELSQYAFLDQVINKIHREKDRVRDELIKNSHVFDDPLMFENVYGSDSEHLFAGVNDLYQSFQAKLDDLLQQHQNAVGVADYEKKEWLSAALAEQEPEFEKNESVAAFSNEIRRLLSQVIRENSETVEGYYSHVCACVRKKIFDNHRASMTTLIIKMLELLYHLNTAGTAVRDLKPDNILLAGKREHGHYSLSDPDAYDLGLIDLETALVFQGPEDPRILQPLLAGTPSYMTPSHLFGNSVLINVFGRQLPAVFRMQDWFAAMGVIFGIVTGQRLFEKTARLIPEIVRVKERGASRNISESEIIKNVSRVFWKTAAEEFSEGIDAHRQRLGRIELSMPESVDEMFRLEVKSGKIRIDDAIRKCAHSQKFFLRHAGKLIAAPVEAIRNERIKWEKKDPEPDVAPDTRTEIIVFFQRLENLKTRMQGLDENGRLIDSKISCEQLLTLVFNQVSLSMQL